MAIFGDRSTQFYHATAVMRRRRNMVQAIQRDNGDWLTTDREIIHEFLTHFRAIYRPAEHTGISDTISPEVFLQIPKVQLSSNDLLIAVPTEREIMTALSSLGPGKAPGLDGFNTRTIQEQWEAFGPSIMN